MNIQELNELLDLRKEELKNNDFSFNFYCEVNNVLKKLIKFLKEKDFYYNNESKRLFMNEYEKIVTHKRFYYFKYAMEIIEGLDKLCIQKRSKRIIRYEEVLDISDYNLGILNNYYNNRLEYNAKRTAREKRKIAIEIIKYFEKNNINNYSELTKNIIIKLRDNFLKLELYSNKKRYLWVLRDFLNYLYEQNIINNNYSYLFDKLSKPNKKLLTVWDKEEIEKIVETLSEDNDKEVRNKAMALITIRLGIRFIDVKNLKFENIDWKNNIIKFNQRKTKEYVELPLPEEVGSQIIKYIKYHRPKCNNKYIFVSHDEYNRQLSDGFTIYEYLLKAYEKSGIDYLSKTKKGIHTFRHSLATNMLKNGIPLDIISSTLGHSNKNSTKGYMSLNNNMLEKCCLSLGDIYE